MRLNSYQMSTELIDAVKAKDTLAVKRIIANSADLEGVDENGMTALLHACELQSFELLKLLVDAGADVNHPNALGYHPLDIAYWRASFAWGAIPLRVSAW